MTFARPQRMMFGVQVVGAAFERLYFQTAVFQRTQ